ncbi:MAG TPA: NYN domain-containing protein [Methylovirgula sp.]|nr:NYN domain-containing protein [Methylovirgula sp.]
MKAAVLIDGGHLRVIVRNANKNYNPDYIEKIALACVHPNETLFRIYYYDCPPYNGTTTLPVSGNPTTFKGTDTWLRSLAKKEYFAVRLGVLKFRGFKPKRVPITPTALTDADFAPDFEQKGVDMRIGLDIATFCNTKAVERIVLITNDTDCIPAMKHARIAGLQVVLIGLPGHRAAPELLHHADFHRTLLAWPL